MAHAMRPPTGLTFGSPEWKPRCEAHKRCQILAKKPSAVADIPVWQVALHRYHAAQRLVGTDQLRRLTTSAISVCTRADEWKLSLVLLSDMERQGLRPDISSCNAAIGACRSGHEWELALAMIAKIPQRGLQCNIATYGAASSACGEGGQWNLALAMLAQTGQNGVQPDLVSYNAAIIAYERKQYWEGALAMLTRMRQDELQPDAVSYNSAMSACVAGGQWETALAMMTHMWQMGLQADVLGSGNSPSAGERGRLRQWLDTTLQQVWRAVSLVPRGRVITYGSLARALGGAWSPFAVGQALKRNPHALVVPCHRVVRADRSLGGYFGGVAPNDERMLIKVSLLREEGVVLVGDPEQGLRVHPDSVWRFTSQPALSSVRLPGEERPA